MTAPIPGSIPGSIPGLLRRGSPVFWRDEETPYVVTAPPHHVADGVLWVIAAPCAGIPLGVQDDPSNFVLDLTDATGRAHAAWWLAAKYPRPYRHASECFPSPLGWRRPHRKRAEDWRYRSVYIIGSHGYADRMPPSSEAIAPECVVPALAALDPADPRLLPDGSRLVDALALAIIVRHVAGMDPA